MDATRPTTVVVHREYHVADDWADRAGLEPAAWVWCATARIANALAGRCVELGLERPAVRYASTAAIGAIGREAA